MSDFESSLQRWILGVLVLMTIALAGMNYWYKVLPEKAARERAAKTPQKPRPSRTAQVVPAVPAVAVTQPSATPQPKPPPRKTDIENLSLTLPDGRILGFEGVGPADDTETLTMASIINPWVLVERTRERIELPVIPSRREYFIPLLLADGRMALIGGNTPRDVVAFEKKCADCADEYMPFGEGTPSTTTDIFDFETGTWSAGPVASLTTASAIALREGGVFKVGFDHVPVKDQFATTLQIETTDEKFTQWRRVGDIHAGAFVSQVNVFQSRNGVVILYWIGNVGARAWHWSGPGKIKPWLEGESWSSVEQLDEGHLQLTEQLDVWPARSKKKIVELP